MDKKEEQVNELFKNPSLPNMYSVLAIILGLTGFIWATNEFNDLLKKLLLLLTIALSFILYFSLQCYRNKKKLCIIYQELLKNCNSQKFLLEKSDEENKRLKYEKVKLIKYIYETNGKDGLNGYKDNEGL